MAGRPILVIPPSVEKLQMKNILIAWTDRREARRAVHDALPLLRLCERAIVAMVDEDDNLSEAEASVNDVAVWLRRHGIVARPIVLSSPDGPAQQFEVLAKEQDADLIVAGGYGHGRWREMVLGGVTHDFLLRLPLCVFLSH
jgi:nucleotide-binding universal stress UspA family protein